MAYYYSESKKAFYTDELFKVSSMPNDVIKLTDTQYQEALAMVNMQQKDITVVGSKLVYVDRVPPVKTWDDIRSERNRLLDKSDYTQMLDWPGDKAAVWAEYRQELRDITENFETPDDVVWPTPPE